MVLLYVDVRKASARSEGLIDANGGRYIAVRVFEV